MPRVFACSTSWQRRAQWDVITTETPEASARTGAKIAMDFPEPVGRTATMLSCSGWRMAHRSFFWFSLVNEEPCFLV